MNDFDIIKSQVDLLGHIRKRLGQEGKKEGNDYKFLSPGEKTASFTVYGDYKTKGYSDFSGRLGSGTVIDFEMNFTQCDKLQAMKSLSEMYRIELSKKEPRKKSPKQIEVFENFDTYRMQKPNDIFLRFIKTRGFEIDTIKAYKENILKVSKEFGTCEGLALGNSEFRDVIVFPCYDGEFQRIGAKLRRSDGEKIGEVKSKTIKDTKTGLLYNPEDLGEEIYICEGEADYFVLKSLGFFSVIGNLSGVNGGRKEIKKLLKHAKKVICLYDNDKLNERGQSPGIDGAFKLQEELGCPIRFPNYPKFDGLDKYDINDLFLSKGWREEDFQKLFDEADILSEEKYKELKFIENEEIKNQTIFKGRFFYHEIEMKYFDLLRYKLVTHYDIAEHYGIKASEVKDLRKDGIMPTYKGVCYYKGGKPGFYNLLDEAQILKPSNTPIFDENIKFLIENLCGHKQDAIDWYLRAIWYKYKNPNDVIIPAVIFHGVGGTGKGLNEKLISSIFGNKNVQVGLNQQSLKSSFSQYRGEKLVVFFNEIGSSSSSVMSEIALKVKSLIMENFITVEKKGQDAYTIENIGWFIFASNDAMPLKLDAGSNGNRRFTVIRTGKFIPKFRKDGDKTPCGATIQEAVTNIEKVSNFLAYLQERFGNDNTPIEALENEDKMLLEKSGLSPGDAFFEWFEKQYPNIKKITIKEKEFFLGIYRSEIGSTYVEDYMYAPRAFNKDLSIKYIVKPVDVRGRTQRGYYIDKEVEGLGYFENQNFEEGGIDKNLPF